LVTRDNSKVYKVPAEYEKNTFGFTFFVYRNNEGIETPICYFSNTWNTIKWSARRREFYLGDLINEISVWDTGPNNDVTAFADLPIIDKFNTPPYEEKNDSLHPDSDHEEEIHENTSGSSTPESDPTTLSNIRKAPIPPDLMSPTNQSSFPFPASSQRAAAAAASLSTNMMLTQTTPGLTQTNVPARTATPPATTATANAPSPDEVYATLLAFLCRTPGGGGSGGGSSGGVPPPGPPQAAGQNVPAPRGEIKTMGQLPQVFSRDRSQANDFVDELQGYLRLNRNVAGFNLPIMKVSLALTLIKGPEVAGWARDMGNWVEAFNPDTQNVPTIWNTFLLEFE
jgi:hypothetical protein